MSEREGWIDTLVVTDDLEYGDTEMTGLLGHNAQDGGALAAMYGLDDGRGKKTLMVIRGGPGEGNARWVKKQINDGVPLERAIWWHLRCNITPPVTRRWVPYAVQALAQSRFLEAPIRVPVELAAAYERFIQPDDPELDNCVDVPVRSILAWLHLELYL